MSTVKEAISRLSSEWSWDAIRLDSLRRKLICKEILVGRGGGLDTKVNGLNFKFRHIREDKDFRIFTNANALFQWRTSKKGPEGKGDRLIIRHYTKNASDKIQVDELFLDPSNPDDGEIVMLDMMYPELAAILPYFPAAMDQIEEQLRRIK